MESVELLRILDEIKKVQETLVTYTQEIKSSQDGQNRYHSDETKELSASLAKAQSEMPVALLNKQNPYFKSSYADMKSIVQAARPSLTKYGLSVVQPILTYPDGSTMLHTRLLHSSGQWIESRMRVVPPKNDIQSMSSYVTYLKRMAYSSLIGVMTGDEDDDGEVAMVDSREIVAKGAAINTKYNPKETSPETISKDQLEEVEYELAEYPDIAELVMDGLKIQSIADMPRAKYHASITRIREIKALRNGNKQK